MFKFKPPLGARAQLGDVGPQGWHCSWLSLLIYML